MIISKIYEFTLDNGTIVTTSQNSIDDTNVISVKEKYSLCADLNKILTNDIITTYRIFVDDIAGWYEIDAPIYEDID